MPAGLEVTVPLPDPELATVNNGLSVKVAVTDLAVSIVTLQGFAEPLHAPDQPAKTEVAEGVAVSITTVFGLYGSEQSVPQWMPPGLEVIVPVPAPVRETDSKRWVELLNWATTAVYFWIETMQGFVCPAHAPDQPIKVSPLAGVAVRLTTVPFGYNSMQSLPQSMPGMVELIVPAPRTSAVKYAWLGRFFPVS